jgi:acylphosphatase
MKRYNVVVSGLVQQVGFRYFVYEIATRFNLTGWVQNCDDGTVEIEVQGDEKALSGFIEKVREGNRFSRVEEVVTRSIELKNNEKTFKYIN